MMAWHSEPDEQVQQDWQVRSAKKREELSISIEKEKIVCSADGEAQSDVKNSAKRSSKSGDSRLVEGQVRSSARASLAGSGIFKQGQREVMVANTHISPSSVVVVTLVGDPG